MHIYIYKNVYIYKNTLYLFMHGLEYISGLEEDPLQIFCAQNVLALRGLRRDRDRALAVKNRAMQMDLGNLCTPVDPRQTYIAGNQLLSFWLPRQTHSKEPATLLLAAKEQIILVSMEPLGTGSKRNGEHGVKRNLQLYSNRGIQVCVPNGVKHNYKDGMLLITLRRFALKTITGADV